MTWLGTPEFKVGVLVVLVSGLIGGMALKVAEGPSLFSGAKKFYFRADSAGGLVTNSAVKMAGIKVGVIDKIKLEDGRAKIEIALDGGTRLTQGARIQLKSDGILGDKHVELVQGKTDEPDLSAGSEILMDGGKGGMDDIMGEVNRVAKNMNELLDTLNKAAKEGDDSTRIGRIIANIEDLTGDLADITEENKGKVNEIVERVRSLSKNIDTYINEESLARVDRSLRNIEEITAKVNKGEGTLGRLINDDTTIDEINTAVSNVNKFLGGAEKLETSIDFHTEYMMANSQSKSYLGLKIQPGLDRYYEIQAIDDPEGVRRSVSTTSETDGTPHTYRETTTFHNKLKITAIFAKNFWDLTLKGGIIENFGGVGVDYFLFNRALRLSVEAFEFRDLQLRAFARYYLFKGAYLTAGGDNLMSNRDEKVSGFIGAGLFITNDDLKLLASKFAF